jgi:ABC-type nitrate/sulfonate/bicarbonate transport system permease component
MILLLTLLAAVGAWELIGRTRIFLPDLFPPVTAIAGALAELVGTPVLLPHLAASLAAVGGGLGLGFAAGVPVGVAVGARRALASVCEPLILYLAVVPKIIVLPVFILLFGIGVESKLAVAASAAFFPIALLTIAGMREVKPIYRAVALVVGARPLQVATRVYLPAVTGYVVGGLRVGLGAAVTGALLAETKVAKAGLGFLLVRYYGEFRIADMYAVFVVIFVLAAAVNLAMTIVHRWLAPHIRLAGADPLYF